MNLLNKSLPHAGYSCSAGKTYSTELTRLTFIPTFVRSDPAPSWPPWDGKDGGLPGKWHTNLPAAPKLQDLLADTRQVQVDFSIWDWHVYYR